ncbi:Glycosyl hydrolase, five-bladed beta-propellor domain-containing protein [Quillaja saponaria]|uniref:Glycosyl hydrolase, five-bladed beta-propellor domain-containing protein n=1 Tax=Quillaja saponaria TaxID=32244 RepID=A0AAD7PG53_QUISA|nr:Glycosyl hydrolase, five-bladed beta-propellor domain-containing protein [Quillaja saponaria]
MGFTGREAEYPLESSGEVGLVLNCSKDWWAFDTQSIRPSEKMGEGNTGFDEFGAMNVCVVRNQKDGKYVMAYEGVAVDGSRSFGLAVFPDGLKE